MPNFTPLQPGSKGPNVKFVQSRLRLPADGIYGSAVRRAVAQYQKRNGLPATGNVDLATWNRLAGTSPVAPASAPTAVVAPWAWSPIVTPDQIGDPAAYEYGPSVVAGRAFMCVGLGTDTICSTGLDSANSIPPAFHVPDKLVADPGAVFTPIGYDLYFTLGNPKGDCNGVAMVRTDHSGRVTEPLRIVIPQTDTPGKYGTGQPSIAVHPNTGVRWLAVRQERTDTPGDQICVYELHPDGVTVKRQVLFSHVEDGASSEAFWHHGKLHLAVAGGGYVGFRTFVEQNGALVRERSLETGYQIVGGGQFWARNAVAVDSGIDGVGVARDQRNQPIIVGPNDAVSVWRGKGDPKVTGTWQVVRMTASLPHDSADD